MSGISKKRKPEEAAPTKYYAVKAGHTPGVFANYSDCQRSTTGFKGAIFKKFESEQDAKDFVAGKTIKTQSMSSEPPKFYGVAVGRVPGVYTDWGEAQKQIQDVKGPKYKKFPTRIEAEAFVRAGGKVTVRSNPVEPPAKKAKTSSESISAKVIPSKSNQDVTRIYTDGSSRGNGKKGALAGVGVFFGHSEDMRNVSEPLEGEVQTNQRAELTAIVRALEHSREDENVLLVTDSQYSINCSTIWYLNWKKNSWRTAQGKEVMNQDLVKAIRSLIDARDKKGVTTTFEWIKGHSNDPGNEAADRLAVAGSYMPH